MTLKSGQQNASSVDLKSSMQYQKNVVDFSQLFQLGIALAREFIGQLKRPESS